MCIRYIWALEGSSSVPLPKMSYDSCIVFLKFLCSLPAVKMLVLHLMRKDSRKMLLHYMDVILLRVRSHISIVFIIRCARYLSAGSNRLSGVNLYFKFWTSHPSFNNTLALSGFVFAHFSIYFPYVSMICIFISHPFFVLKNYITCYFSKNQRLNLAQYIYMYTFYGFCDKMNFYA